LILIDWKKPGLDGIETSGRIRGLTELSLQPKIILVTTYGVEEATHQAGGIHLESTTASAETEKEAGSVSILLDLLKKLDPCLQNREPKPSKTIMEEIAFFRWPEEYSSSIEQLAKLISRYKFGDAQQVLITLTDIVSNPKEG